MLPCDTLVQTAGRDRHCPLLGGVETFLIDPQTRDVDSSAQNLLPDKNLNP